MLKWCVKNVIRKVGKENKKTLAMFGCLISLGNEDDCDDGV